MRAKPRFGSFRLYLNIFCLVIVAYGLWRAGYAAVDSMRQLDSSLQSQIDELRTEVSSSATTEDPQKKIQKLLTVKERIWEVDWRWFFLFGFAQQHRSVRSRSLLVADVAFAEYSCPVASCFTSVLSWQLRKVCSRKGHGTSHASRSPEALWVDSEDDYSQRLCRNSYYDGSGSCDWRTYRPLVGCADLVARAGFWSRYMRGCSDSALDIPPCPKAEASKG